MSEGNNNGNGDKLDNPGHITSELCLAFRKTISAEMKADRDKITFTIKIVGTITALALAVLQLALHYMA